MSTVLYFIKAIAAGISAVVATGVAIAADENISFDEIGVMWLTIVGAIAAIGTALSPANRGRIRRGPQT